MTHIDQLYERLGITTLQADVLIALMENGGSATAPEIISTLSTTQKVNRTSIYSVLKTLERMQLVLPAETGESRSISYSLVSTSPEKLVELLVTPQQAAITDLTLKLQEAKLTATRTSLDSEFYSLKSIDQILQQLTLVIEESEEYLLLMANSLMLQVLLPTIQAKLKKTPELEVFLQPTWNPDNTFDFQALLTQYREILGSDRVARPLDVFSSLTEFGRPMFDKFDNISHSNQPNLLQVMQRAHYAQIITNNGMVMATYFEHTSLLSPTGAGMYTKELLITQNYLVVFFSIFKAHADSFDDALLEKVITTRLSSWITMMQSILDI